MTATEMLSVAAAQSDKHFLFRCGQAWFSVPAIAVREVTITPEVVSVPGCHPAIEGLCRQQSEFIPVISLAALLDLETTDTMHDHNQLMTLCGNNVWAIRIAEALALESLETLSSPEIRQDDSASSPIIGTAVQGDQIVRVLNPERLYQLTNQALEIQWSGRPTASHPAFATSGDQR